MADTNSILVKNLPDSADEELLEMFFESTKRQGGGPVKCVKIYSDKNAAIVEFYERKSVEIVLGKRPIKLGKVELEVQPFKSILKGTEVINRVMIDMKGLPQNFTDDLMKKQLGFYLPPPDYGPELAALIKFGSRVVRGRDWHYGDQDSGGKGTVTAVGIGKVQIKWDNGSEIRGYSNGINDEYTIKLA